MCVLLSLSLLCNAGIVIWTQLKVLGTFFLCFPIPHHAKRKPTLWLKVWLLAKSAWYDVTWKPSIVHGYIQDSKHVCFPANKPQNFSHFMCFYVQKHALNHRFKKKKKKPQPERTRVWLYLLLRLRTDPCVTFLKCRIITTYAASLLTACAFKKLCALSSCS